MRTLLLTLFWMHLLGSFIEAANLLGEHPRARKPATVGEDSFRLIITIAMLGWIAIVLWAPIP